MRALPTRFAGITFRSRTEARWAVFFTALGLKWEFEPQGFDLSGAGYLPDFWLPELQLWLEVKPGPVGLHGRAKAARLAFEGVRGSVAIAYGPPALNENVIVFDRPEIGVWSEPMAWLEDRKDDFVFWLGNDDGAECFGGSGIQTGGVRWPGRIGGVVETAVSAALDQRFGT